MSEVKLPEINARG